MEKISFEESLGKHVLPSLCVGCATCVTVCPIGCLEYIDGKPVLAEECNSCGICSQVCPRYKLSIQRLERFIFGRERKLEEEFGIYRRIVIARTRDDRVRKVCQDGGVVTSLLLYALEEGIIDGAVVSGIDSENPLKAAPKLAESSEEIIESAGTRYTYSPNMLAFKDAVAAGKKSLAFVGTPCQIQAVRKIQAFPLNKYARRLNFTVGVFCSECFVYDGLVNRLIKEEMGINPNEVKKMNIKGKFIVTTTNGDVKSISLKKTKRYVNTCVSACSDFSAELADISVGGLGLNGWTFTILRTERGEKIFEEAKSKGLLETKPVERNSKPLILLINLSGKKRREAEGKNSS